MSSSNPSTRPTQAALAAITAWVAAPVPHCFEAGTQYGFTWYDQTGHSHFVSCDQVGDKSVWLRAKRAELQAAGQGTFVILGENLVHADVVDTGKFTVDHVTGELRFEFGVGHWVYTGAHIGASIRVSA